MKFHAYDAAGAIDVSAGWTDLTFDTEVVSDAPFSLSGAEITINTTGWYEVAYYVAIETTSGTSRSESEAKLQEDIGSGFADIPGSLSPMYNRTATQGSSNASVMIWRHFNSGDKIKLQASKISGGSTLKTLPNGVGITLELGYEDRVANLENIHAKLGWHNQEVIKATYRRPKDLLIYYGWPNAFNSASNQWNNEKVAQDMAKYTLIVLGAGLEDPSHGDYSNTQIIIPRIKALNPNALIFGYVTVNQDISPFQTKVDQWETLQVHGIFMDEAGYDFGKTRAEFNTRVDYVHGKTNANKCFANAWNTDHILGTANDPSYPNTTYNPGEVESNLNIYDWALLESFGVNTAAYTGSGQYGFEPSTQWAARGVKFMGLRATYGVNFAGVGIINNGNSNGIALAHFGFVSSLMWSLEGWGTSDTNYGASSAAVDYWSKPDITEIGAVWSLNPSVQNDVNDNNLYHRYVGSAKLTLNCTPGGQSSSIAEW
jgi:hypothetical protein